MSKSSQWLMLVVSGALLSGSVIAADTKDMPDMKGMNMPKPSAKEAQGVGVIKSIDAKANTVTIAHEPITALKWPAMTMAFKVAQPAVLENVKPGAKVHFTLDTSTSSPTVSRITPAD